MKKNTDAALLVLRIALALVFTAHGCMKMFVMHPSGVAGFFASLHVPMAPIAAWAISLLEFGGGLALGAGLLARPLAALFVCDMAAAIALAVFPKGFVGGYELEFTLMCGSAAVALAGAGRWSIDAWLAAKRGATA